MALQPCVTSKMPMTIACAFCWPTQFCKVYARDYKQLARMARKTGVRLRVKERFGLPFLTHKHRKRLGAFIGICAFCVLMLVMQNFVWTLEVKGNERNSTERVMHVLGELGLRQGAFIPSLDIHDIQDKAVLELDNISWFTINNYSSGIVVEMKEAEDPPNIIDENAACNVVALKAGVIRRTEVYAGKCMVEVGKVVAKGDLLVSGVLDYNPEEIEYKHARGKIFAETYFDEVFEVEKSATTKEKTGNVFDRHYLNLFGFKLPLFIAFPVDGQHDVTVTEAPVNLFGFQLPFTVETLHYEEYVTQTVIYNEESARETLNGIYENYKETQMTGMEVLDETPEFLELEHSYRLKVSFICLEDIAVEQKIFP